MLEELLQKDGGINGDKGLMAKDRHKRISTKNCFEGIGVISKFGGTGVSSGGCSARRRVDVMFAAESFAHRGCAEEAAIEASRLILAAGQPQQI